MLFGGHDRGELLYPAVCFSLTFNAEWSILYPWPRKYTKAHKKIVLFCVLSWLKSEGQIIWIICMVPAAPD